MPAGRRISRSRFSYASPKDEASRQEFYNVISTETDRLRRMIDNLLNISQIEAGLMHIERDQVDFKIIVLNLIKYYSIISKPCNILWNNIITR